MKPSGRPFPVARVVAALLVLAAGGVAFVCFMILIRLAGGPSSRRPSGSTRSVDTRDFDLANETLLAYQGQTGFGNTPQAQRLAQELSRKLELVRAVAFTGGRSPDAPSLTQGHFLTHCEMREATICFLVHVPELRHYEDGAKSALGKLAWATARQAVSSLPEKQRSRLGVGLRGIALYGVVMVGSPAEERPRVSSDSSALHELFSGPLPSAPGPPPLPPSTAPAVAAATPMPALSTAERLKRDIEAIGLEEFEPRHAAQRDLESLGLAAVPLLIRTARDPTRSVNARATAMLVLGKSRSPKAIPVLLSCLEDSRAGGSAGEGLRYVEGAAKSVLPQLARDIERRCVKPPRSDTKWSAYCFHALPTLGRFGPAAGFAAPTILRVIQNHPSVEDYQVRTSAITVAVQIGPAARDAVPFMIAGLGDSNTYVTQESIRALSRMGPAATAAIPALEGLRKANPIWTKPVEEALARIRSDGAGPYREWPGRTVGHNRGAISSGMPRPGPPMSAVRT